MTARLPGASHLGNHHQCNAHCPECMSGEFHAGQRLSYDGNLCSARYFGPVEGTRGDWLGVEWDDPSRGKHNGEHNGERYFQCTKRHLVIVAKI